MANKGGASNFYSLYDTVRSRPADDLVFPFMAYAKPSTGSSSGVWYTTGVAGNLLPAFQAGGSAVMPSIQDGAQIRCVGVYEIPTVTGLDASQVVGFVVARGNWDFQTTGSRANYRRVGFFVDNTRTIYATAANGSTSTNTSTGHTVSDSTKFMVEWLFTKGTDLKVRVNRGSWTTITTNLPTGDLDAWLWNKGTGTIGNARAYSPWLSLKA